MSIFKNLLKRVINTVTPDWLTSEVDQIINEDFMKAFAGACALIACADGKIDSSEEAKILSFIKNLRELKSFDSSTIMQHFREFANTLNCDPDMGREKIYTSLKEIKGDKKASKLLVRICCHIGAADGDFDSNEKQATIEICRQLGIEPNEFPELNP